MNTIDECMKYAAGKDACFSDGIRGLRCPLESNRKYITYTTPDGMKCRDNKLHEEKYCKEAMEHEFRIRAKLVQKKIPSSSGNRWRNEADESAEQCAAANS